MILRRITWITASSGAKGKPAWICGRERLSHSFRAFSIARAGWRGRGPEELDRSYRRETYVGFSDGMTAAFELAAVPAVLGWVGHLLDRVLGIVPVLTILFAVASLVGLFARMWWCYEAAMRAYDQSAVWGRRL